MDNPATQTTVNWAQNTEHRKLWVAGLSILDFPIGFLCFVFCAQFTVVWVAGLSILDFPIGLKTTVNWAQNTEHRKLIEITNGQSSNSRQQWTEHKTQHRKPIEIMNGQSSDSDNSELSTKHRTQKTDREIKNEYLFKYIWRYTISGIVSKQICSNMWAKISEKLVQK
jgi:hypothetical protein